MTLETRCRRIGTHSPHEYRGGRCPGQPCEHDKLCCAEHGHHVTPHRGCILR